MQPLLQTIKMLIYKQQYYKECGSRGRADTDQQNRMENLEVDMIIDNIKDKLRRISQNSAKNYEYINKLSKSIKLNIFKYLVER